MVPNPTSSVWILLNQIFINGLDSIQYCEKLPIFDMQTCGRGLVALRFAFCPSLQILVLTVLHYDSIIPRSCVIIHTSVCEAINRSNTATQEKSKNLAGLSGSSGNIEPLLSKSSLSTDTCPVSVTAKDRGKLPEFEKGCRHFWPSNYSNYFGYWNVLS